MSSSPPPNTRRWRFTWETLAHTPTLRLYLFNPNTDPSSCCGGLSATLRLDERLLLISWSDEAAERGVGPQLRVPVPRLLIDPARPVECWARQDHIEIKLTLVLPVDHPLVANLQGILDPAAESSDRLLPLSLSSEISDLKSLSYGGVHFYCKNCSTKLTRQPLRHFVEMPSVNWREAADNWFGSCCCSFGGISEKLVAQYISNYDCTAGTCLLDVASVIVSKEDLEAHIFDYCSDRLSNSSDKVVLLTTNSSNGIAREGICGNIAEGTPESSDVPSCVVNKVESVNLDVGNGLPLSYTLLSSAGCCENSEHGTDTFSDQSCCQAQHKLNRRQIASIVDTLKLDLNYCSEIPEKPVSECIDKFSSVDQSHCCVDKTIYALNYLHEKSRLGSAVPSGMVQQPTISSEFERNQRLHNGLLGSGFITRTSYLSNGVNWIEFSCKHCLSFLGSYPSLGNTNVPVDGGVRLFKCYISTCDPAGGLNDIFRKYTLQRVFTNSLLENAEDELSFRTVVRDLKNGSVMLQIVLLNSKVWCSTGYCFETVAMESVLEKDLQPVAKVLFSDCSAPMEADPRLIKNWSAMSHVEEVYMMKHLIEELIKCLRIAGNRLPSSCSSFQGMTLSSIER